MYILLEKCYYSNFLLNNKSIKIYLCIFFWIKCYYSNFHLNNNIYYKIFMFILLEKCYYSKFFIKALGYPTRASRVI